MLSIEVTGAEPLQTRFAAMPAAIQTALRARAEDLAQRLRAHVVQDKLSGQVLKVRSGALRDSIQAAVDLMEDGFRARVFSAGDVKYAAIQEFGGRTSAHDIAPRKVRALAFVAGGKTVFAKLVHHPGSRIPERSYLRSSLADMADQIAVDLKGAVVTAMGGGEE